MEAKIIPINSIWISDRTRKDYGDIEEIVESASREEIGQIQSIAVKEEINPADGRQYRLIAGDRRLRAFKKAGLTEVLARIYPPDLPEKIMLEIELLENIQRMNLGIWEEIEIKERIHKLGTEKDHDWSEGKTAELLGISRSRINEDLELADLARAVPDVKKCKTKAEARSILKKVKESIIVKELGRRAMEREAASPLESKRKKLMDSYITGDSLEGLKAQSNASFDLIELDPPYASDLLKRSVLNRESSRAVHEFKNQEFVNIPDDEFLDFMRPIFEQSYRVLKNVGWVIVWHSHVWTLKLAALLEECGFSCRSLPAIWNKNCGEDVRASACPDYFLGHMWEPFLYVRKGQAVIKNRARADVFNFRPSYTDNRIHPTEKPVALYEDILRTFSLPGDRILSPFLGSGNVLFAAANLGMDAIGYEISEGFRNGFLARAATWTPPERK